MADVVTEANPLLLVYVAEIVCVPTLRPVSVAVATPEERVAVVGEPSTVNTTVPVGVSDGLETVALTVTV